MQANYVQRLRLHFRKRGQTRFIGHLDVARALERWLNRARIPVAYTQGFNRRPRMQLAAALPLGFTSDCELADIWLGERRAPEVVLAALAAQAPPGLEVHHVVEAPLAEDALQNQTRSAEYEVLLLDEPDETDLQTRVADLLAADRLLREKRGKKGRRGKGRRTYDLRPLIHALDVRPVTADAGVARPGLHMHVSLAPGRTGRPDEVLAAMDLDPLAARIHRVAIHLAPPSPDAAAE